MADQTKTKIILRNGTAAQWTANNPVLLAGEAGIETDTQRVKYGNGTAAWNDLAYAAGSKPTTAVAWGDIGGTPANQTDLKNILDAKESTANRGKPSGYTPLNEDGKVPSIHLQSGFTAGMIMMWSGALASIPSGWALCDGQDGRPNLLGKFIRGVGTAGTQPGGTGGSDNVTLSTDHLPAHTHTLSQHTHTLNGHSHAVAKTGCTADEVNHSHGKYAGTHDYLVNIAGSTVKVGSGVTNIPLPVAVSATGGAAHSHPVVGNTEPSGTLTTNNAGGGNTGSNGSGQAFSILPSYFELAFIIKL